ncbi:LexA family protein [Streptomyces sp. NPDC005133]
MRAAVSAERLTVRQESVLRAIRDVIADTGDAPTIREIGRRVGLFSTGSVAYQLGRLEKLGLISRTERRWRSCRLAQ